MTQFLSLRTCAIALCLTLPTVALAGETDTSAEAIERLKQENAEMKAMMMELQRQVQELAGKTQAAQEAAQASTEAVQSVSAKKENLTIKTTGGGIQVKSDNGNQFKVGGRIQLDNYNFDDFWTAGVGGTTEENKIRRSRLGVSGASGKSWAYKLVVNFNHEGQSSSIDTGFAQYNMKPYAVRVGKFKVPAVFENRTSSKWIATMERSILSDLAVFKSKPSFGGVALLYSDTVNGVPVSGAIGVYDNEVDEADGDDIYSIGARFSVAPQFGDNHFMHAGVTFQTADYRGQNLRARSRLGVNTGGRPFDSGALATEDVDQYGLELAYVNGPFALASEYMMIETDGICDPRATETASLMTTDMMTGCYEELGMDVDSYYLQATYTLTGEVMGYKNGNASFTGIKPKGAGGAWELVAKYEDATIEYDGVGAEADAERLVLGVNWYATRSVRLMLNYYDAEVSCGTSTFTDGSGMMQMVAFSDLGTCGTGDVTSGEGYSMRVQYAF